MVNRSLIVIAAVLAAVVVALPALAAVDTVAALDYLQGQQNQDGGFGSGFGPDSSAGSTADAVLAIISAGGQLAAFDQGGDTPLTYLAANAASIPTAGDLSKVIMASVAAGQNPRTLGGVDLVARLESAIGSDGRIGGDADIYFSHLLGVLALKSVQRPIPTASVEVVREAQLDDGSWSWDGSAGTAGDTNSTAFALQALAAAGEPSDSVALTRALDYFGRIQNEDGGWPYQDPSDFGTDTDANSTAVTIQALIALGRDPAGVRWTETGGNTPVMALEALQNASGAFAWQATVPDDNLLATLQALPALAGKAFPIATMDVGEAAAVAPSTTPQTGGQGINLALPLLLAGVALATGGVLIGRRRS